MTLSRENIPGLNIRKKFTLTMLAAAIGVSSPMLYAQEVQGSEEAAKADDTEIINVVGIRQSLAKASDIKREASGVVDAISAIDVGKFPDTNLAESLQRVTGVSVDRSNGEGNQITVRGFGPRFNLVTLNGRSMPTSSALNDRALNRSFNFSELAASSISEVEVYKTGRADIPTGGIGSTVNVKTAKPFQFEGFRASGAIKVNHDTSNVEGSDFTPDVNFLVSNHFNDKTIGVLASMSYSKRDSRSERGLVSNYQRANPGATALANNIDRTANQNPEELFYLARNFGLEIGDIERERINGQFVLQFAPTDDIEIDIDYHLSRFEETSVRNQHGFWFSFNPKRTGISDENGVVNIRDAGEDVDFFGFAQDLETDNDSLGINVKWDATDNLSLEFDAHRSISESQPDGNPAEALTNFNSLVRDVTIGLDFENGDIPNVIVDSPSNLYTKDNIKGDIAQYRGNQVKNTIEEYKVKGTYEFYDLPFIESIHFGASTQAYTYNATSLTSGNLSIADFDVSLLDITFPERGSIGDSFTGGGDLFTNIGYYNAFEAIELAEAQGLITEPDPRLNTVDEDTSSYFITADFASDIGDMVMDLNVGLRYEETDVNASSQVKAITGTRFFSSGELSILRSDEDVFESIDGDYDFLLPSVDFRLEVIEDLIVRLSYSETVTRAAISNLVPETAITQSRPGEAGGEGIFNARQGNASLEPAKSKNIDLSVEWYYTPESYASIGFFRKEVTAFLTSNNIDTTLPTANGDVLRNPAGNPRPGCPSPTDEACLQTSSDEAIVWNLTQPVSSDTEGTVDGFELALQHVFESGFGVIANYTYTNGDIEYDLNDFDGQDPAPLAGLSDSANLIGFYEKGPYQIRVAYNWRDEFLATTADNEPTFVDPYQQIDMSASYEINEKVTIFVEGVNLTDEINRRHRRYQDQLVSAFAFGPRYSFGVRGKF